MTSVQSIQGDGSRTAEEKLDEMLLKAEKLAQQMKANNEPDSPAVATDSSSTPVILTGADDLLYRISEAKNHPHDATSVFCDDSTIIPQDSTPALMRQTEALLALLKSSEPSPEKKPEASNSPQPSDSPMHPRALATPPHSTTERQHNTPLVTPPSPNDDLRQVAQAEAMARLMQQSLASLTTTEETSQTVANNSDSPTSREVSASPGPPLAARSKLLVSGSVLSSHHAPSPEQRLTREPSSPNKAATARPPRPTIKPSSMKNAADTPKRNRVASFQASKATPISIKTKPSPSRTTPRKTNVSTTAINKNLSPTRALKMNFREGDDLLRIADLTTRSPLVKWEKVSNAAAGDEDYVPLTDYSHLSPRKITRSLDTNSDSPSKNKRRRKKMMRIAVVVMLAALLLVLYMLGALPFGGDRSDSTVDTSEAGLFTDGQANLVLEQGVVEAIREEYSVEDDAAAGVDKTVGTESSPISDEPLRSNPSWSNDIVSSPNHTGRSSSMERGHLEKNFARWTRSGLNQARVAAKNVASHVQSDLTKVCAVATNACVDEIIPGFASFSVEWKSLPRNFIRVIRRRVQQLLGVVRRVRGLFVGNAQNRSK